VLHVKVVVDVFLHCDWLLSTWQSWFIPRRYAQPTSDYGRVCKSLVNYSSYDSDDYDDDFFAV